MKPFANQAEVRKWAWNNKYVLGSFSTIVKDKPVTWVDLTKPFKQWIIAVNNV